jgi:hypothetical protein
MSPDIVKGSFVMGFDPGGPDTTSMAVLRRLPEGKIEVVGTMEVRHFDAEVIRNMHHDFVRRDLEQRLRARKVGEAIIERVLRLNPEPRVGVRLRGLHYKEGAAWGLPRGLIQKGEVLRRYGREAWARIPRERWVKDGRRVWVRLWDVEVAVSYVPERTR